MCGIYGFVGKKRRIKDVFFALKKLEYRGYDSYGLAYNNSLNSDLVIYKDTGHIKLNYDILNDYSNICISHTRWATHGSVSINNSHSHYSQNKRYLIVHNGIITNANFLYEEYLKGISLYSETDTEIIVKLFDYFTKELSPLGAIKKLIGLLEGSFAFLIMDTVTNTIYFAKVASPLIMAKEFDSFSFASDQIALENGVNALILEDNSYGYAKENELVILSKTYENTHKEIVVSNKDIDLFYSGDFMIKEIKESPSVISEIKNYKSDFDLDTLIKSKRQIIFLGCGTSFYACKYLEAMVLKKTKKQAYSYLGSEFPYSNRTFKNSLFIFVSQSGETYDLINCFKYIDDTNTIVALVNSTNSTIAYKANYILDMGAKREMAVASTKSFLASITTFCYQAKWLSDKDLELLSQSINDCLLNEYKIKELAKKIIKYKKVLFIGRGSDYTMALEASLKLREVSYLTAFAFPSGELKHGSLAIVDSDTLCIGFASDNKFDSLITLGLEEAKARGSSIIKIGPLDSDLTLFSPLIDYSPLLLAVFGQLLSYYAAKELGRNVDKPKNLAKSVTVE